MRIEVRQIVGAHRTDEQQTQGELRAIFANLSSSPSWRWQIVRIGLTKRGGQDAIFRSGGSHRNDRSGIPRHHQDPAFATGRFDDRSGSYADRPRFAVWSVHSQSDEVTARRLPDPNALNVPTAPIAVGEALKAQAVRLGHRRGRREFPTPTAGGGSASFIAMALTPGGDARSPSIPRLTQCGLTIEAL